MSTSPDQQKKDRAIRKEYVECVEWLINDREFIDLGLIKTIRAKKNLPVNELNSSIEQAEKAIMQIIIDRYEDENAAVKSYVDKFILASSKGG